MGLAAVYGSCLCIGLAFGGLFVLSRQANALANFLQMPIYLLAGFFVPRAALPGWLQDLGTVLPLTHAIAALREAILRGASVSDIWEPLSAASAASIACFLAGLWGLRRVDTVVRRRATLDLS